MLLIIDGNNIAYRAHFTPQGSLTTKAGEPSGVIKGFLESTRGYLQNFPEIERVVVCWDTGKAEWRKAIFPEYKGNRDYGDDDPEKKESFENLWKQIDILHEILPKFGVQSIRLQNWEADDLVYRVSTMFGEEFSHAMIVTSDKDMYQLVNDKVSIFRPGNGKKEGVVLSPLNFKEIAGVEQEAYIGYKSLLGDPSDNIMGVPGIGEKTAANLINKYGHIDNLLADRDNIMKAKAKRNKAIFEPANLKRIGLNHKLMNFQYVPENEEVSKLVIDALTCEVPNISTKEVKDVLIRWQFVSILTNLRPWITPFFGLESE
jgi:DNA polymerase I